MAPRGAVGYQPTLHVLDAQRSLFDPSYLNDPRLAKVLPSKPLDWYRSKEGRWFESQIRNYFPRF